MQKFVYERIFQQTVVDLSKIQLERGLTHDAIANSASMTAQVFSFVASILQRLTKQQAASRKSSQVPLTAPSFQQ